MRAEDVAVQAEPSAARGVPLDRVDDVVYVEQRAALLFYFHGARIGDTKKTPGSSRRKNTCFYELRHQLVLLILST